MLKALTAAAAITICCLGNGYPAKSYGNGLTNQQIDQQRQLDQLRQQQYRIKREQEWQRVKICPPNFYCN